MHRTGGLVLAAASLVACGPSYAKLKVDKIQRVAITVDDRDQRFCAYRPVALRAVVTYLNGKQALSRVPGERSKGRLRTSEFEWSASHGTVDALAVLALPHAPLAWYDAPIQVTARVLARPELVGEAALHPRFDCGGTLDLRGTQGPRGGEAEHGGPGDPGPEVHVALTYLDTQHSGRLVLVRVQRAADEAEHFIIDPRDPNAPFVIDARGGNGGRGGQGITGFDGDAGANGLDGTDGVTCHDAVPGQDGTDGGPGGPGGPGGDGGRGGDGGTVFVRYDARFPELATRVQVRVDGGEAGQAGTGGAGGRAGTPGRGGKGGTGAPERGPDGTPTGECGAPDGRDGVPGSVGPSGPGGTAGSAGAPGQLHELAVEVHELFADELQRGLPIATSADGGNR